MASNEKIAFSTESDRNPDNVHTAEDLRQMQAMTLRAKILTTQARLIEWYSKNNGNIYISFSGGKDSTVLLHIARQLFPDIPAVYIDTGLEFPELRDFVKTIDNVTWLKPEMNFRKVIETYGYPLISKDVARFIWTARRHPNGKVAARFEPNNEHDQKYGSRYSVAKWKFLIDSNIPISHKCCDIMKKNPAKKYEKETGNKPVVATMACESQERRTQWLQYGCNVFSDRRPISRPMSFWTEQDILEYILKYNLDYAPVYGDIVRDKNGKLKTTKRERTGCVFCPLGCQAEKDPNRFQQLKVTHPQLYDYCMKSWDKGGLGMKEVLEFINVKTE